MKKYLFKFVHIYVNIDVSNMFSKLGVHLNIKLFNFCTYGNCYVIVYTR